MTLDYVPDLAGEDLAIETLATDTGQQIRLQVHGELDSCTDEQLVDAVTQALATSGISQVDMDLAGVRFMDAAGVRSLLTCRRAATEAGIPLTLVDPNPMVTRVLDALGLLGHFTVTGAAASATGRAGRAFGASPRREQNNPAEWSEWSPRARQQSQETRDRAQLAVDRSATLRPWDS